jgi:hypothetical protein
MAAKLMLAGIIGGVVAIGAMAKSWPAPEDEPAPTRDQPLDGWLSKEAAAQIFGGEKGGLGPLFAGMWPGSTAPSKEATDRIAAFARAHNVEIDLDIENEELVAIRFSVVFGGCCGYQGADILALRLGRPKTSECCGCANEWVDDWAISTEDGGLHVRTSVRVNRVKVRWQKALTVPQILERADGLVGKHASQVARTVPSDRWRETEPGLFLLELPFPNAEHWNYWPGGGLKNRTDLGLIAKVENGIVVGVSGQLRHLDHEEMRVATKSRWGKWPREADEGWTWTKPDRVILADPEREPIKLAIDKR